MSIGQRPGIKLVGQSSIQAVVYMALHASWAWADTTQWGVNDLGFKFLLSPLEALAQWDTVACTYILRGTWLKPRLENFPPPVITNASLLEGSLQSLEESRRGVSELCFRLFLFPPFTGRRKVVINAAGC